MQVLPAVAVEGFDAVRALAHRAGLAYALGIHPLCVDRAGDADLERLAEALQTHRDDPRLVAVGEIGLDFFRDLSPRAAQAAALSAQLELARTVAKPVLLHCRDAHADLLAVLAAELGEAGGIMHCFSGDLTVARRCLDLGLLVSIAGPVTYPNAHRLAEVVRAVPLDRLVLETDCPYLPPQPWRGRRNEPAYLPATAARVAELLDVPLRRVTAATTHNASVRLGIPPPAAPDEGA
jgi:TatD DNase family protein